MSAPQDRETPPAGVSPSAVLGFLALVVVLVAAAIALDALTARPSPTPPREIGAGDYLDLRGRFEEEHAIWRLGHVQRSFDFQLLSSRVIFWVSMLISVSGVAFAFSQFTAAVRQDRTAEDADSLELKTAMASLAFKTRSAAALVLFVSLAYLLLYLLFVYRIEAVDAGAIFPDRLLAGAPDAPGAVEDPQDAGFAAPIADEEDAP